jgi:lipid-A-disaccharide synthase
VKLFVVAGEASGDRLGAGLMREIAARVADTTFTGVGGPAMAAEGLTSLFPMSDLSVMGIGPVLARLLLILRRIRETAAAALAARPDAVVLIDSPDFAHRVAKRIRAAAPDLPLILYVSPTVWAWRRGRAAAMRPYTDLLLALLPFEPAAHAALGGPRTVFVGHPLLDIAAELRRPGGRQAAAGVPHVVVLPGSRRSEVRRLMPVFGAALRLLGERLGPLELTLPTVPHVEAEVRALAADWATAPAIVVGEDAKRAAFRAGDAALAASGTVTLELALAELPHVLAYKLDAIGRHLRRFVHVQPGLETIVPMVSAGLPNILVAAAPGQTVIPDPAALTRLEQAPTLPVPEFLDDLATPENLAMALERLLADGPERARQRAAFAVIERVLALPPGLTSSAMAAVAVLDLAAAGRR